MQRAFQRVHRIQGFKRRRQNLASYGPVQDKNRPVDQISVWTGLLEYFLAARKVKRRQLKNYPTAATYYVFNIIIKPSDPRTGLDPF